MGTMTDGLFPIILIIPKEIIVIIGNNEQAWDSEAGRLVTRELPPTLLLIIFNFLNNCDKFLRNNSYNWETFME